MEGSPLTERDWERLQGANRFDNGDAPLYIEEELDFDTHIELVIAPNGATLVADELGIGQDGMDRRTIYHAPFVAPSYEAAQALAASFGSPGTLADLLAFGFMPVNEERYWPDALVRHFRKIHGRLMQDLVNLGEYKQERLNAHEMKFDAEPNADACQTLHRIRRLEIEILQLLGTGQTEIEVAMREDGEGGRVNLAEAMADPPSFTRNVNPE